MITTKSEYKIEVSAPPLDANTNQPVYIKITDTLNNDYIGIWLTVAEKNKLLAELEALNTVDEMATESDRPDDE